MRYILVVVLLIITGLSGVHADNLDVTFIGKYEKSEIKLRWLPKDKNFRYHYKIYREEAGKKSAKLLVSMQRMNAQEAEAFLPKEYKGVGEMLFPLSYAKTKKEKMKIISQAEQIVNFQLLMADQNILFAEVLALGYVDKSVEPAKRYIYTLKVYDDKSNLLTQKTLHLDTKAQSMAAVIGVEAEGKSFGVGIRWKYYNQYGSYNIYRSEKLNGKYLKLNEWPVVISYKVNRDGVVEAPPYYFIDDTAKEGKIYFYKVSGIDAFGSESPKSLVQMAKRIKIVPKPNKMPKPILDVKEDRIKIQWKKVKDAAYYNIYRSYKYEDGYVKINKKPLYKTSYTDKNVLQKASYFYKIKAVAKKRVIAVSRPALGVPWDTTPPDRPKNLHAKVSAGKVVLYWNSVKAKDILGYRVYRNTDPKNDQWLMLNKSLISELKIVDTLPKVQNKIYYYYKVIAFDKNQNMSKPSKIIKIKLPDVTAPKKTAFVEHTIEKDCLNLKWKKSASTDVKGYFLYKKSDNRVQKINKKPIESLSYRVCGIQSMKKTYFAVSAVDKSANISKKSDWLLIRYRDKIPPKIEAFSLKKMKTKALISFTSRDDDIDGFRVYRSEDGKFFEAYSPYIKTKNSFTDLKRKEGKIYYYYIKVYDISGNMTKTKVKK
jgi:fibronectin type 3 domain-containing protein